MNLLDRYVAEVGKYLPRRGRADIEAEIRSTLEDMLEERSHGTPATETQISDLLKEYGDPRKVAASYGAKQYLIGPRLYPTFELVLKIVFTVLFMLSLVGFGFGVIRAGLNGPAMTLALAQAGGQFIASLVSSFGSIVLVFAILERTLPASRLANVEKDWNPADLAREPDPDQVKYPDMVVSIIFTLAFVVVLNRYPQLIGIGFPNQGQWTYISVLSPAFFQYVPWIDLLCLLSVLLRLWLLRRGSWDTPTRIISLAMKLGTVSLAFVMIAGPSILSVPAGAIPPAIANSDQLSRLATLLSYISIPMLLAMILGEGLDAVKLVRRLLAHRPAAPYEEVMK